MAMESPALAPKVPEVQVVQVLEPASANVPTKHLPEHEAVESPELAPKDPLGQLVHAIAAVSEYVPIGQTVQLVAPDTAA